MYATFAYRFNKDSFFRLHWQNSTCSSQPPLLELNSCVIQSRTNPET